MRLPYCVFVRGSHEQPRRASQTYIIFCRRTGVAPGKSDSSVQKPENEGKHQADQNARGDRCIKSEISAVDPDVAGEPAKSEPREQWPEEADHGNDQPDNDQDTRHRLNGTISGHGLLIIGYCFGKGADEFHEIALGAPNGRRRR